MGGLGTACGVFVMKLCLWGMAAIATGIAFAVIVREAKRYAKKFRRVGFVASLLLGTFIYGMIREGSITQDDKEEYRDAMAPILEERAAIARILLPTDDDGLAKRNDSSKDEDDLNALAKESDKNTDLSEPGQDIRSGQQGISDSDYEAGVILAEVRTNEVHDFTAPTNSVWHQDWLGHGGFADNFRLELDGLEFPFGTNSISALTVFQRGLMRPRTVVASSFIAPMQARLGAVPSFRHSLLPEANRPSGFWHCFTPSNSVIMTWRNFLLGQDSLCPVTLQAELFEDGCAEFRYDLSLAGAETISNIVAGIRCNSLGTTLDSLDANVTTIRWQRLNPEDVTNPDPDSDGISTYDEIFVYHTAPYNADSDYDGISDYDEINTYSSDPNDAHSINSLYCDSFALVLGDEDPFAYPEGSTNTIYEHILYTGTTNAPFAYPVPTDEIGVLKIMVSGSGAGRLVVGDAVVPLLCSQTGLTRLTGLRGGANPDNPVNPVTNTLLLVVGKGVRKTLWWEKPDGLDIAIDSDDLLIGELPTLLRLKGWIAFPNTKAKEPCIHDLNAKKLLVYLDPGRDIRGLVCTWNPTASISVEAKSDLSAELTGSFPRSSTTSVTYTLTHPHYLCGATQYTQTARFCPRLSENDDDDLHGDGMPMDEEYGDEHACSCSYGACCGNPWCDCGCACCEVGVGETPANICDEHNCPYDQCEDLHHDAYTNAMAVASMVDVLKLDRNPVYTNTIPIDVPDGWVKCCDCPDHWTNYVALTAKSYNLAVRTASGERFERTVNDCSIYVHGLAPSRDFEDSILSLCKTGVVYETHHYTVLGLKIDHPYFNLKKLNDANPAFGFPVVIGTNRIYGADFRLRTDVDLPSGNIHIGLDGNTPGFKLYLGSPLYGLSLGGTVTDDPLLLADSSTGKSFDVSLAQWKKIMAQHTSGREITVTLTAAQEGATDIVFGFAAVNGNESVSDIVRQRVTAIKPPLKADFNHNGRIDAEDVELFRLGNPFRFWINEDIVRGNQALGNGNEIVNSVDSVVNGKWDLVNLFPVVIDLSSLTNAWQTGDIDFRIGGDSWGSSLNVTFANVAWNNLGAIQTNVVVTSYGDNLYEAALQPLMDGDVSLSDSILGGFGEESGILVVESKCWDANPIALKVYMDGVEVCRCRLPIFTTPVQHMYRWINDRDVNVATRLTSLGVPYNPPYTTADAKNLVMLHGANVSPAQSEKWGDYIFKRFWHSGFRGNYYFVSWTSDLGVTGANYQENVSNAFVTASSIAETIKAIPGDKVLMAHSLGNMVVSAMIEDHGLVPSAYIMCNSAVPIEAFDPEIEGTNVLVHQEWVDYPTNTWSKSWHTLFPEADSRSKLTWRGRFPSVAQYAFNFYSTGDHCLELFQNNHPGPFDYEGDDSQRFEQYCWHKQDIWKGRAGLTEGLGGTSWSGWGFAKNALGLRKFSVTEAQAMSLTPEVLTTNTVFRINPESMNTNVIERLVLDAHLAQGIPAWAPATGAMPIRQTLGIPNFNLEITDPAYTGIERPNGWPSFSSWGTRWLHSDMKDRAYFYVFKFYEKVMEVGGLK